MDTRYGIGMEEAEFIIADYLKIKGYKLFANFSEKERSKYVQYSENDNLFIAFADDEGHFNRGVKNGSQ